MNLGVEFWGPLFGFLTACVTAVRWLIIKNARLVSSNERLRSEYNARLISDLQVTLKSILPVLENNTKKISEFEVAVEFVAKNQKEIANIASELKDIAKQIRVYFDLHQHDMSNLKAIAQAYADKINRIETEVIQMKNGNVFVKTKK